MPINEKINKLQVESRNNDNSNKPKELPYTLSISQAVKYYGIGEKSLRKFLKENPEAKYILRVGSTVRIKKAVFERHLDENITII